MATIEAGLGIIIGCVIMIVLMQTVCFGFLLGYVLRFKTTFKLVDKYMCLMDNLVKENYDEISKQMRDLVDKTKEGIGSDE